MLFFYKIKKPYLGGPLRCDENQWFLKIFRNERFSCKNFKQTHFTEPKLLDKLFWDKIITHLPNGRALGTEIGSFGSAILRQINHVSAY